MINKTKGHIPLLLSSFFVPLILFILTSSTSLMFDDAAEFALVSKLGSIAHPPGTPSFIFSGFFWLKLTSVFGLNTVVALNLLSSLFVSAASCLIYLSFRKIAFAIKYTDEFKTNLICCLCAISFSVSSTTWMWANTVEVYSLQVFAMALALFGLINYNIGRKKINLIAAAAGIGIGLGNHHLTMIVFLPFLPFFFLEDLFFNTGNTGKTKSIEKSKSFLIKYLSAVREKTFLRLVFFTTFFTLFFYGWMLIRATHDYPFMFGKPSTIGELIYHVSGSTYLENITSGSDNITGTRISYFLKLTFLQLFLFLPLFFAGIWNIYRRKLFPLFFMIILFYLGMFFIQVNNNQWSSTDAYMLLPFMFLTIPVFYGAISYAVKIKAEFLLPALLISGIIWNFPNQNRKSYPVSSSLMKLLDESSPPNSIVIIGDWTLIIQYYFYRLTENFRPDLIVLNNDIKFNHYRMLPTMYPDFYNEIKKEYDNFVDELMKEHPEQAAGTGCDLTTEALVSKFKILISKIEQLAKQKNVTLLTDPKAHYFFSSANMYDPNRFVSGCFSSSIAGTKNANENFLQMDFGFLKSPMLLKDPAALDKMVDFQTILYNYMDYYRTTNDSLNMLKSVEALNKVLKIQREMKKNMPFAFITQ